MKASLRLFANHPLRQAYIILSVPLLFADLGSTSEGQEELHQSIEFGTW